MEGLWQKYANSGQIKIRDNSLAMSKSRLELGNFSGKVTKDG
jgi:hypothetical protein